jgi:hypothetical protein
MDGSDMSEKGPEIRPAALEYERTVDAPSYRPRWVYAVLAFYVLCLCALSISPVFVALFVSLGAAGLAVFYSGGLLLMGVSLMVIPVQRRLHRGVTKRSIWIPLLGSSVLIAMLAFCVNMAVQDANFGDVLRPKLAIAITAACWAFWVVVFASIALAGNAQSAASWLYKALLTANLLELLIAVPAHLVARRRTECCAGIPSAIAIIMGAAMAVVVIGPIMFWLYYRRWERIRRR